MLSKGLIESEVDRMVERTEVLGRAVIRGLEKDKATSKARLIQLTIDQRTKEARQKITQGLMQELVDAFNLSQNVPSATADLLPNPWLDLTVRCDLLDYRLLRRL